MIKIINNNNFVLSVTEQEAVRNAALQAGVSEVKVHHDRVLSVDGEFFGLLKNGRCMVAKYKWNLNNRIRDTKPRKA